jgi:outer membrane lipoprotein-sorting protein
MSMFRRLSSRGLAVLIGAIAVFGASTVVAVNAMGGGGSTPPPEPLAQSVHDALSASPVDGITARIKFTNNLLGSSALGSLAGASGSPLLSGASGRLWLTNDGHLRIELQSDAGDAQIVTDGTTLSVYDASSNTAYQLALPADTSSSATGHAVPSLSQIGTALTRLATVADVSVAVPSSIAGQPAYTVTVSPKANGGLVGSAELAWDAATGVPLHAAIYAKGDAKPVLDLTATDISYGPVPASDVNIAPPPGATIVPITLPAGSGTTKPNTTPVTGVDAVAAALPFTLAAPDTLDGLARNEVRLTGSSADPGALVTYGQGLGTVLVTEHAASSAAKDAANPLSMLPSVSINGSTGHELVTTLGTIVEFENGGVSYTVAGSVTQSDAEQAARALAP